MPVLGIAGYGPRRRYSPLLALVATIVLILFAGHHGAIPTAAHVSGGADVASARVPLSITGHPVGDAHSAPREAPEEHCPASLLRMAPPRSSGEAQPAAVPG